MKITRTARLKRAWQELTEEEKELGRMASRNLATDLRYPALRVKKMQGGQAYFWTTRWQKAEKEAAQDIKAGRVKSFDSVDELIKDLEQK